MLVITEKVAAEERFYQVVHIDENSFCKDKPNQKYLRYRFPSTQATSLPWPVNLAQQHSSADPRNSRNGTWT
jgi:hypothetical protein